jgi:hypothetical protein
MDGTSYNEIVIADCPGILKNWWIVKRKNIATPTSNFEKPARFVACFGDVD